MDRLKTTTGRIITPEDSENPDPFYNLHMPPTTIGDLFDSAPTKLSRTYSGSHVKVLDDISTPEERDDLISLAESRVKSSTLFHSDWGAPRGRLPT